MLVEIKLWTTIIIIIIMSSFSRLILRRSSSPNISAIGGRNSAIRSISPLATSSILSGSINNNNSAHGGSSRGYASAFTQLRGGDYPVNTSLFDTSKTSASFSHRSMSDLALPDPPTSNHPHHDLPTAKGRLIYTET